MAPPPALYPGTPPALLRSRYRAWSEVRCAVSTTYWRRPAGRSPRTCFLFTRPWACLPRLRPGERGGAGCPGAAAKTRRAGVLDALVAPFAWCVRPVGALNCGPCRPDAQARAGPHWVGWWRLPCMVPRAAFGSRRCHVRFWRHRSAATWLWATCGAGNAQLRPRIWFHSWARGRVQASFGRGNEGLAHLECGLVPHCSPLLWNRLRSSWEL